MNNPQPDQATTVARRRVIVTAAARGIGRAVYEAFVEAGDDVLGIDILDDIGATAPTDRPGRHRGIIADLRDSHQVRDAMERGIEFLGGVDVLVNVAGGPQRGRSETPQGPLIGGVSEADFDATWAVNVKAALLTSQRAAVDMKPRGSGCIVTVGSGFGERAAPGRLAYATAKSAVTGLTRSLAVDWGPHGIRVNEIVPYAVTEETWPRLQDPETGSDMVARIPLGYLAEPTEIAPAVLFLASDQARYITGARLHIDGGRCIVL